MRRAKANKTRTRRLARKWYLRNRDKVLIWAAHERARRAGAVGMHTGDDIEGLFEAQRGLCVYCDEPLEDFHVDHIKPLVRGGTNWPDNLQLTCAHCNYSKRDRDHPVTVKKDGKIIPYKEHRQGRTNLLGPQGPLPAHVSFI